MALMLFGRVSGAAMTQEPLASEVHLGNLECSPTGKVVNNLWDFVSAFQEPVQIGIRPSNPLCATVETIVDAKPRHPLGSICDIVIHTPDMNLTQRATRRDIKMISVSLAEYQNSIFTFSNNKCLSQNTFPLSQYGYYYNCHHAVQAFHRRSSGCEHLCLRNSSWQPDVGLETPE
jgi:hypothetical protein